MGSPSPGGGKEGRLWWLGKRRRWPGRWGRWLRSLFSLPAWRARRLDAQLLGALDDAVFRVAYALEALILVSFLGFYFCCCGCRL